MTWRLNHDVAMRQPDAHESSGDIRMRCPIHGGRSAPLSLTSDGFKALWHCHAGCDPALVGEKLAERGVISRRDAGPPEAGTKPKARPRTKKTRNMDKIMSWCHRRWDSGQNLDGTPAIDYFACRRIPRQTVLLAAADTLRWLPGPRPELLAKVTDEAGEMTGLHRTIFLGSGKTRRCNGTIRGSAIRMFTGSGWNGRWTGHLTIAEGIESALSFFHLCPLAGPAWSLISAGGIGTFKPPEWVRHLTVAADFDGAGISAWEQLSRRLDIPCDLRLPGGQDHYKRDWNDLLKHKANAIEGPGYYVIEEGMT